MLSNEKFEILKFPPLPKEAKILYTDFMTDQYAEWARQEISSKTGFCDHKTGWISKKLWKQFTRSSFLASVHSDGIAKKGFVKVRTGLHQELETNFCWQGTERWMLRNHRCKPLLAWQMKADLFGFAPLGSVQNILFSLLKINHSQLGRPTNIRKIRILNMKLSPPVF